MDQLSFYCALAPTSAQSPKTALSTWNPQHLNFSTSEPATLPDPRHHPQLLDPFGPEPGVNKDLEGNGSREGGAPGART